ncbi:hypothetical protein QBC35DRAFT_386687 [Podospora australis]|uniref:Cyclin n=1 Tax=Podospora australis TaxID=1536484 RepID=A0AAN6WR58_9PEZI|nr:hypothetical protein QBC35DRAFT_386687 [Podospora australis]
MGTTYEMPHLASSKNHHMPHQGYGPAMPQPDRFRPALNERTAPNEQLYHQPSRCPAPIDEQQQQQSRANSSRQPRNTAATPQTQPPRQPTTTITTQVPRQQPSRSSTPLSHPSLVFHSMDIPECISKRGGNLAHFMAEITALLWFESIETLEEAERVRTNPSDQPIPRLPIIAVASTNFKKWVSQVVSTTQITQNVVFLALLYIYRLKMTNPTVRGRLGSEYRLLTIAMMLGNKFLDDNTYTNKTWADVSGIGVSEIHVMEVEFLSNMRYTLLVSAKQWSAWLDKLSAFWEYVELAQRSPSPSPSPLLIPSPTHRGFASPLPSPTGNVQLTPGMHSGPAAVAWPSNYPPNHDISPLALRHDAHFLARKRSFPEDDPTEPPAKRIGSVQQQLAAQQAQPRPRLPSQQHSTTASQAQVVQQRVPNPAQQTQQPRPPPGLGPDQSRLAVPNLTLNTGGHVYPPHVTTQPYSQSVYAPPQASPLSLPPLVPGVRAMSTVYPTTTGYAPQQTATVTAGPNMPSVSQAVTTPTTSFPPMTYGTPTKRLSPQHPFASSSGYAGSSPAGDPFGHHGGSASGLHTPISHSPSVYLQQRNSPYKPVRQVNTLLIPPPSAFLHQYHFPNAVTPNQMHYQPLGRRNEYRTGIVPEYTVGGHQGNQAPPSGYLPHPNQPRANYAPPMGRPDPSYRPQY